jgi:hypothetical protein
MAFIESQSTEFYTIGCRLSYGVDFSARLEGDYDLEDFQQFLFGAYRHFSEKMGPECYFASDERYRIEAPPEHEAAGTWFEVSCAESPMRTSCWILALAQALALCKQMEWTEGGWEMFQERMQKERRNVS